MRSPLRAWCWKMQTSRRSARAVQDSKPGSWMEHLPTAIRDSFTSAARENRRRGMADDKTKANAPPPPDEPKRIGRREVLKGLSTVPALGLFGYAWDRQRH